MDSRSSQWFHLLHTVLRCVRERVLSVASSVVARANKGYCMIRFGQDKVGANCYRLILDFGKGQKISEAIRSNFFG